MAPSLVGPRSGHRQRRGSRVRQARPVRTDCPGHHDTVDGLPSCVLAVTSDSVPFTPRTLKPLHHQTITIQVGLQERLVGHGPQTFQPRFSQGHRFELPGASCDAILSQCKHADRAEQADREEDRKSTRLNSSHSQISYAVFCLKKKKSSTRSITDLTESISTRSATS